MLIFINFGAGGRYWWVGPLAGLSFSVLSSLLQEWYADRRRRLDYELEPESGGGGGGGSVTFDVLDAVLLLVLAGLVFKLVQMVRQRGGLRAALERRHQQQQAARAGGAAARPRPDFDRVVAALQKLPTEVVATRAELDAESIPELKRRLAAAGADCRGAVEKAELVAALLAAGGGSSGEGCAICAEEYVPSDVVRVLPCRHRMHLECIDRWLLKSTEHSAPKGCPLCNDERWLGE